MSCRDQDPQNSSDCLEGQAGIRPFDASATAWLVGEGVRYLNTAGKEGELAYQRVIETLRTCSQDVLETVTGVFRQSDLGDAPLRWSLLYVLGDAGDRSAADFLVGVATKPLPEVRESEGCETSRDVEMLVSTMAVHALKSIAQRDPEAAEQVLAVVKARPTQAILIEAVKVGVELKLTEKIREMLPEEDRWILDIRRARTEELIAEPEREDGKERGFTPPKSGALYTAPSVICSTQQEG